MKTVLKENHILIEKVRALISQFSYTVVMITMKLLAGVTPPTIYHGCSTLKTFWEESFTGEEKLFLAMNMKICGHNSFSKNKEIKGSDTYFTLDVSLKFDSMKKMKITSSESKEKLEILVKGLITYMGFKAKESPRNTKRQGILLEMSARRTFL